MLLSAQLAHPAYAGDKPDGTKQDVTTLLLPLLADVTATLAANHHAAQLDDAAIESSCV
jgi:hypothetical protein